MAAALDEQGLSYEVERKRVRKQGEERIFVHIHINDRFPFELTIYAGDKAHYVFKSSITGKAIERASIAELEQLWPASIRRCRSISRSWRPRAGSTASRSTRCCCLPLENVKESPKYHPEGDALYHSLQVFDLACDELPYDEEFLLAALLHDVGKAIDRHDHVAAGAGGVGGAYHAADRLVDRPSHGGPGLARRRLGRSCPAAVGGIGRLRRAEAPGPLRPKRPAARRGDFGVGRRDRVPSRVGGNMRGVRSLLTCFPVQPTANGCH